MPRDREQVARDFVRAWLRKADTDLHAAAHLLTEPVPGDDYFAAAFHAQQAAEKLLKALLIRHQVPFPKTHDIERLLRLLAAVEPGLLQELTEAVNLTPYGVEFRYPLEEHVSHADAHAAVGMARRVQEAVLRRLVPYLGGRGNERA
mgnify:CR=1 FL=1